jgi:hypothetical protein
LPDIAGRDPRFLRNCPAGQRPLCFQDFRNSIAACAADMDRSDLPGLVGALRVVLSRMGNFPALRSAELVYGFRHLPTQAAIAEEQRRDRNEVDLGGLRIVLTDFQRELWRDLAGGENVAVSAPTSAGKSFVLQAYLRRLARSGKLTVACYIVPMRSLCLRKTAMSSNPLSPSRISPKCSLSQTMMVTNKAVALGGDAGFQQQMVEMAAAKNMALTFADPLLERRRRELLGLPVQPIPPAPQPGLVSRLTQLLTGGRLKPRRI